MAQQLAGCWMQQEENIMDTPPFKAGDIVRYHPQLRHIVNMGMQYRRVIDCCDIPEKMADSPNYVSNLMILEHRPDGSFVDILLDYDVPCWMLELEKAQ
jgi:hypothetical protein